jgi:hypothetical protein
MRKLLGIVAMAAIGTAAQAQMAPENLSPVQQYLYYDTGYAPYAQPPQPQPEPESAYDTAYAPADEAEEDSYYEEREHLNGGVRGMNF